MGFASDMFSVGVTLFEMATGKLPDTASLDCNQLLTSVDDPAKHELLSFTLHADPSKRPTAEGLLQRIAALAVGSGWCAAQPDLDHIPVVYFHDNTKADALVRKGLGGAEPRFELFYLGTRANPTMAKFEALPGTKRWARDYKWLRPQYYKRSPFRISLNLDGDAVPCGARLVEAFRAFTRSQAAVAGLWHVEAKYSGLNTGFMAWDRDKAKSLLAAWADGMRRAILANRTIRHDQPSLAAALNATRGVEVLRFSEANVCRVCRADKEGHCASTCASDGCWVDHRDWGPNYNKAGIDGIAKVDGGTKVSKLTYIPSTGYVKVESAPRLNYLCIFSRFAK